MSQIIQQIYDRQGEGKTVGHEWGGMDLYKHFCDHRETSAEDAKERIDEVIRSCPHHCIVGNGYQQVLSHFQKIFGTKLRLIHLQRRNREQCVFSMSRNGELFPGNHKYYAPTEEAHSKRMAAFHFGEKTREEWDALPLLEKYGWYYDKTHELIREFEPIFSRSLYVETEGLGNEKVREAIAKIAGADFIPAGVHVNRHIDTDAYPVESRVWIQRALGKLDIERLAADDVYGLEHFLNEFAYKMSYRSQEVWHRDPETLEEISKILDKGRETVREYLEKLDSMADAIGKYRADGYKTFTKAEQSRIEVSAY